MKTIQRMLLVLAILSINIFGTQAQYFGEMPSTGFGSTSSSAFSSGSNFQSAAVSGYVSADDYYNSNISGRRSSARRIGGGDDDDDWSGGDEHITEVNTPIGDGLWILLILAAGYLIYRRKKQINMKQSFTNRALAVAIALTMSISLWAVPAKRGWQTKTQPDGSTIKVELRGDEFYHYWVDESGMEVKKDANGYWQAVGAAPTGSQVMARMAAGRSTRKASTIRKAYGDAQPTRLLVILVQFKDKSFNSKYTASFYDKILNQTGGDGSHGCGSVKDYFNQSSDGNYIPTFDIFGPVTLDQNMSYYGANDSGGDDVKPREMALEACQKADAAGCNFANYDMNNDGKVDNVYIIYAGYGEAGGGPDNSIWPHSWEVSGTNKIDGKTIKHYACSPELSGGSGSNSDGIATFCHEFSHVIGMPDYYDTDYGTNYDNNATPGDWSLMDGGSYNGSGWYPPLYSIYDRYFMGWATPTILKDPENVTMPVGSQYARQISSSTSLQLPTATSTIYYLENRQKTGFDSYNPGAGLVIWKVTYSSTAWSNNDLNNTAGTLRYTICRADGKTTNIGNTKDAMPAGGTSITPISGHAITNVALTSNVITFLYNGGQQQMTVTFDGNGHGTPASASLTETSSGSGITLPSCSANTGYTFKGWATTEGAATANAGTAGQKYYPTNNITLYAVYEHTGYVNLEYSLEGVTKTFGPDAPEFLKNDGYAATFTAANGYDALTDDNCLYEVRVNNVDVTSSYASITSNTLTISIPSANITGGVSVTIVATKSKGSNTFEQVTSMAGLSAGDEVIFVNEGAGVAAAGLHYGTTYLDGEEQTISTSTTPHSLELPDETQVIIYTLGGSEGAWTFSREDGNKLGTTGAKAMSFTSGTNTWTLSFSGNNLVMTSTTSSCGSFQYNASTPRFTTYTSTIGNLQIYKRAIVSDPVAPDFSFDQTSVNMTAGETSTPQLPVTNSTGVITYTSSNTAVATVNASTGAVTAIKQGTVTITANVAATKRHLAASASYTVNISRAAATITAVDNFTVKVGKTYSLDATTTSDAAISYTIADGSKLTREGKVFTGVAAGSTTVTLSTAQTDKYEAAEKVINVTVEAVVTYTVNWNVQGISTAVIYEKGDALVLPSFTPEDCSATRTFQGWTANGSLTSTDVAPTYITLGGAVNAAANYYAVYATSDAGALTPTSVSKNSFTAASGDLDANISFAGAKGAAGNDPYITTDNYIRIYQNGGTFTVSAKNSKKITAVTLGSNQGTTIDVKVDGSSYATGVSLPTTTPYSTSGLDASTIVFTCKGTSKTTRLEVNQLSVTYLDAGASVKSDYSLTCSTAAKTDPTASFTESSKVMTVGEHQTQQVTTNSTGAVTYSSSAPAVASVNASTGEVTALTAGSATISVNIAATNKYNAKDNAASYTVTVNRATGTITASDINLTAGQDKSIGATTNTGATISYVSASEAVATVTSEGVVHGVAVGSTTITMTTAENDTHTAAEKVINVTVNSSAVAPSLTFTTPTPSIAYGEPYTQTVQTNSDGLVTYASNNAAVAEVDAQTGEITTVGVGSATITASVTATSSYTAHATSYTLTVTKATNTLTFAQASASVQVAAFVTNVATAKFGTVVYSSNNTDVATVNSSTGEVKGVAAGTATITATVAATDNYDGATKDYEVTVTGAAGIDMQAHVASQEGRSAYNGYVTSQTGYYTGDYTYSIMMTQSGSELFGTLNTLMGNTKQSGGSYDDLRTHYVEVDRDLNTPGNIIGYYDGKSMNGTWDGGNTYNREHTWPQSKGADKGIPMGYDMQSVRPANASINSSRGNTAYGEGSGFYNTDVIAIDNVNYKASNRGSYHGDAARVILYDYIVYGEMGGHKNSYYNGAAQLLNKLGSTGVFESLPILLKWHMQDPPSLTEMVRNDGAQGYKGNRNPFIDYPELAILLLKDQTGVTTYTVTNSTAGTMSPNYTYTTTAGFVTYLYNSDGTTHPSEVNITNGTKESYDASTGRLIVSAATGNVVITSNNVTPAVTYTITATSNDEAMGTVSGGGTYNQNAIVTLTATPTDGHKFVEWQDGSHVNPRTITVTGNATYTATFDDEGGETPEGDITVTWVTNNGQPPVVQKYFSGQTLVAPATPADGGTAAHPKYFVGWSEESNWYSAVGKNPDDLFISPNQIVTKDVTYYAIYSSIKPAGEQ